MASLVKLTGEAGACPTWPTGLKTAEEMSAEVGVPAGRLLSLAEQCVIPHYRIDGGTPMFRMSQVKQWVAENLMHHCAGDNTHIPLLLVNDNTRPDYASLPRALAAISDKVHEFPMSCFVPGIYFLCRDREILYVGQSVCVAARVPNHGDKLRQADRIFFLPVPYEQLDNVENALIRHLRPPLNRTPGQRATRAVADVLANIGMSEETQ